MPSGDPTERYRIDERGAAVTIGAVHATGHLSHRVHIGKPGPAVYIVLGNTTTPKMDIAVE